MSYVSPVSGNDPTRYIPPPDTQDTQTAAAGQATANGSNGTNNTSSTTAAAPNQAGPTPQQATDAAVKKVEAAQTALDKVQATANNPKGTPASISQAQASLPGLQKNLTDAQAQLKTAVDNEITSKVGGNATPAQVTQAGQEITARYSNDATAKSQVSNAVTQISVDRQVHSIVASAQAQSDPVKAVQALNNGYTHAAQPVKDALLKDAGAQQILQKAAQWADQPVSKPNTDPGVGFQAPALQTMQRLAQLTNGTDSTLGAQLVHEALPQIESANKTFQDQYGQSLVGYEGIQQMMKVVDNISGTPTGNDDTNRFAAMGFWNSDGVSQAIANGATPTYAIALAQQKGIDKQIVMGAVTTGMSEYQQKVDGDVDKYVKQTQELNWLINNGGSSMTSAQLSDAIAAYAKSKGPAWQKQYAQDTQQLADDGQTLLKQFAALHNLPPSLSGFQQQADAQINSIMDDKKANAALSIALQQAPKLTSGGGSSQTLDFFATMKLTDAGRKLATEAVTAYMKAQILPDIAKLNRNDPSTFTKVQSDLEALRNSTVAKALGVAPKDFNKAIDYLEKAIPAAGDDETAITAKLATLDENLGKLGSPSGIKGFDKSTLPGQLIRGLGLAAAGASFLNDFNKATNDPTAKNVMKTFVDAAGVGQKSSELALGLGWVSEKGAVGQFGGAAKIAGRWGAGEFIAGVGALFDAWSSVDSFEKGDNVSGSLYAAGAVGGLLTAVGAGSWLGPVGIGLAIASTVGLAIWNHHEQVTQYETPTTTKFLQNANFSPQAAQALTQQSGDGHSPVPLLARFAQLQGLDLQNAGDQQKFANWINSLSPDQLKSLVAAANDEQDRIGGDVSKFNPTSRQDGVPFQHTTYSRFGANTTTDLHTESAALMNKLLQYLHAPQLH